MLARSLGKWLPGIAISVLLATTHQADAVEHQEEAERNRPFYMSALLGGAHLDVGRLTGIDGNDGHGSLGVAFGVRFNPGFSLELGHRRISDGDDDDFSWGESTDLRLDSLHFGPVFDVPLGSSAALLMSAGIQAWRYRFTHRNIPFPPVTATFIERRDSGAGGYARIGGVWKMNANMEFGGHWSYLDIDDTGANVLEARFNYRF